MSAVPAPHDCPPPTQGELFPDPRPPLPPTGWASTSKAAAHAIRDAAPAVRARVLAFIASRGPTGATIDEMCTALRLGTGTVCPRVDELARPKVGAAAIRDSGRRRATRSGRSAKVWVVRGDGDGAR